VPTALGAYARKSIKEMFSATPGTDAQNHSPAVPASPPGHAHVIALVGPPHDRPRRRLQV